MPQSATIAIGILIVFGGCHTGFEAEEGLQILRVSADPLEAVDSVVVSVTFANHSEQEIVFRGRSRGMAFDLEVRDLDGTVVWRFIHGAYAAAVRPYKVAAGSIETLSVTWPTTDFAGNHVPAGTYDLIGLLGDDLDVPIQATAAQRVTVME